ncbi:hypothetical protein Patl1_08792 [Pistacia atlantica]|uniref:Uncharacterized protein n=1 Tax=Pistacia atlantica TaxID=434234 RepID=A0ACC1AHF1_9ROSI|nr:hypothetical protein Patl1_08792 [Pistacia atlantica]
MSKLTTLFTVALLFTFMLTYSATARPNPTLIAHSLTKTQLEEVEAAGNVVDAEESCEGVGNEECLRRRTLGAHLDYIYTQNHNNP